MDDGKRLWVIGGQVHDLGPSRPRAEIMAEARARGTHTPDEWTALVREARTCRYCDVELNVFNGVQDHKVPVVRGGSDAIENLDYICWQCNLEKAMRTPDEWCYGGPRPRPFAPAPRRRREWERLAGAL